MSASNTIVRKNISRHLSMQSTRKVRFGPESKVASLPPRKPPPLLRSNSGSGVSTKSLSLNYSFSGNVMDELVECGICLDRLKVPKMLPCQHTFCLACLEAVIKADPEFPCPTCRKVVQMPDGPGGLPSNLYLDSLLAAMTARDDNAVGAEGVAGNATNTDRCVQCQIVGNVSVCQHCKQMLCAVCWPHHVAELRRQMGCLQEQLQGALAKLNHKLQDFDDKCTGLHGHIDEAVERKIASVRELQVNLNEQANEIQTQGNEGAKQLQEELLQAESNISFLAFDNVSSDSLKVSLFLELHSLTSGLLDHVTRWGEARPTFDQDTFKIYYEEEVMGEEELDEEADVESSQRPLDQVASPDSLSLHYRSMSAAPRLSVVRNGLQRPASLVVSPWNSGYIFVAGTDNKQVLVVDRVKGRIMGRLTAPDMLCPQGVACSSQRLYVTDKWNHQIHVFNSSGEYVKALGKKGNGDGQMRSPEGIAVGPNSRPQSSMGEIDDDMLLYVCDTGNDRVQILRAHDGSLVKTLGIVGSRPTGIGKLATELCNPSGVAINDTKIVVADTGNRRIKVYSMSGDKMVEFGSHGGGRGQFRSPECVAVDSLGFILVGDSGNSRIQIFRPNGNLVRVLGGRNAQSCNLGLISGITVITDTMEIISADSKNHGIHFF